MRNIQKQQTQDRLLPVVQLEYCDIVTNGGVDWSLSLDEIFRFVLLAHGQTRAVRDTENINEDGRRCYQV